MTMVLVEKQKVADKKDSAYYFTDTWHQHSALWADRRTDTLIAILFTSIREK